MERGYWFSAQEYRILESKICKFRRKRSIVPFCSISWTILTCMVWKVRHVPRWCAWQQPSYEREKTGDALSSYLRLFTEHFRMLHVSRDIRTCHHAVGSLYSWLFSYEPLVINPFSTNAHYYACMVLFKQSINHFQP